MASRSAQQSRRTAAQMHALAAVRRDVRSQDVISRCKYLREFTDAFQTYDSVLESEDYDRKLSACGILLIGDYHALPASQQFAASLLENCARERPVVLAVEAVLARDQHILDAWWRREIAGDDLRRALRFDREWGYPWEPFYELMCSARDHAEGLYGLDCMPRDDLRRIRSRDCHAAAKIRELRERHPNAIIVTLFGESHLAPQHLPRALHSLMSQENILAVLQNVDALYWQAMAEQETAGKIQAVSVADNAICVFNASPLEKYESYRLCLDRWKTANTEEDFAPAVYNLIFSLARSLEFQLDSPHNGTQPKFLADLLPEVVTSGGEAEHGDDERPCVYSPESNSFFIREFSVADAAGECARFLHFACRGMTPACAQAKPVVDALAHFGARLLSPELRNENRDSAPGDTLYQAYLSVRISPAELRKLFLARLETRAQAESGLSQLRSLIGD